jgi:hypothetical protein
MAREQTEKAIFDTTLVSFDGTLLSNLCPSCFMRSEEEGWGLQNEDEETADNDNAAGNRENVPRMTTLCVDGNMQHYRLKWVSKWEEHEYTTSMYVPRGKSHDFSDAPKVEGATNLASGPKPEVVVACGHSFAAEDKEKQAAKPVTMQALEETGLMACVCRHGHPLRFLDLYRGENSESTLKLLHAVIQQCPHNSPVTICYDIACRFGKCTEHLRNACPQREIQVILNGFHAFAHEMKCRLLLGPLGFPKIGMALTESTEPLWQRIMHLVTSGRRSSAVHRAMMIEHVGLFIAEMKRRDMFKSLSRRWELATKKTFIDPETRQPRSFEGVLNDLLEELPRSHPELAWIRCSDDLAGFLREQIEHQKAYFLKKTSTDYLKTDDMAVKYEIFQSLQEEAAADEELLEMQTTQTSARANRGPFLNLALTAELKLQICKRKKDLAVAKTDDLLASIASSRNDWNHDCPHWIFFNNLKLIEEQDILIRKIHQEVGSRYLEQRDIKSRVRGQKAVKKLLGSLRRRMPNVQKLTSQLNKHREKMPEAFRTPIWSGRDFTTKDVDEGFDKPFLTLERIRDQLFQSAVSARPQVLGEQPLPESEQPNESRTAVEWLWQEPAITRGINALLHIDRCNEELLIIPRETQAAVSWLKSSAQGLANFRMHCDRQGDTTATQYERRFTWDIVNILERALQFFNDCPTLRQESDVEELQGRCQFAINNAY